MEKFDDCYITVEKKGKCYVCGKLTNKIEYTYETYICSKECENMMDMMLFEAENRADSVDKEEMRGTTLLDDGEVRRSALLIFANTVKVVKSLASVGLMVEGDRDKECVGHYLYGSEDTAFKIVADSYGLSDGGDSTLLLHELENVMELDSVFHAFDTRKKNTLFLPNCLEQVCSCYSKFNKNKNWFMQERNANPDYACEVFTFAVGMHNACAEQLKYFGLAIEVEDLLQKSFREACIVVENALFAVREFLYAKVDSEESEFTYYLIENYSHSLHDWGRF